MTKKRAINCQTVVVTSLKMASLDHSNLTTAPQTDISSFVQSLTRSLMLKNPQMDTISICECLFYPSAKKRLSTVITSSVKHLSDQLKCDIMWNSDSPHSSAEHLCCRQMSVCGSGQRSIDKQALGLPFHSTVSKAVGPAHMLTACTQISVCFNHLQTNLNQLKANQRSARRGFRSSGRVRLGGDHISCT